MRPQNLDAAYPRNVLGVRSVKYPIRQIFWGCGAGKYLTEPLPSNFWGVYSPQIFDGTPSVKYLGALHPPNM